MGSMRRNAAIALAVLAACALMGASAQLPEELSAAGAAEQFVGALAEYGLGENMCAEGTTTFVPVDGAFERLRALLEAADDDDDHDDEHDDDHDDDHDEELDDHDDEPDEEHDDDDDDDDDRLPPAWLVTYHMAEGDYPAAALSDGQVLDTLSAGELTVDIDEDGTVTIESVGTNATVVAADVDIPGCSGTVHLIDIPLLPFDPLEEDDDDDGVDEDEQADRERLLGAIESGRITDQMPPGSIMQLLLEMPDALGRFVFGVFAEDLVENFADPTGEFTVFVPPDSAFLATEEMLGVDDPEPRNPPGWLLMYHVVPGKLSAADLTDGQVLQTMSAVWEVRRRRSRARESTRGARVRRLRFDGDSAAERAAVRSRRPDPTH